MNCKKAQELMLTDYIDGEMSDSRIAAIEKHINSCPECREFSMAARKVGNGLFSGADRAEVPEYLWRRVRETILAEDRKRRPFASTVFEKLRAVLYIPKPALAIITVLILMLAIGSITKIKMDNQAAMKSEYFDYFADSSLDDNSTFGTSIEKYFM